MMIENLISRLPRVAAVIGEKWLKQKRSWAETFIGLRLPWYEQLERDLLVLGTHIGLHEQITCYRNPLRDQPQIQKTMFEVHGAALLASVATRVRPHVPAREGSRKNFDLWAEIRDHPINAESKTRKDEFPFNLPPGSDDLEGIAWYAGIRATVDPHDTEALGIRASPPGAEAREIATPESTVIRQLLLDGLSQLPEEGCNLILFGHIDGRRQHLEEALYGTEVFGLRHDPATKRVISVGFRVPTGAFGAGPEGEPFRSLSAVLWIRLRTESGLVGRAYKLYMNPNTKLPLANVVVEAIAATMKAWSSSAEG